MDNLLFVKISEINDECEVCEERRPFFNLKDEGASYALKKQSGDVYYSFQCFSCRTDKRVFVVRYSVDVDERMLNLEKFGEFPRRKLKRDKNLQRFFKDDLDNFEKATVCLATGYGVAAFAYFRRILENNIVQLLKLVREDAVASGAPQETLDALDELENPGVPMSKKIEKANAAMPPYLKPEGLNPLGKLYANLSDGVHSAPEEECFKRANAIQFCLAFLIGELSSRKRHRESFKSQLASL
ncbi:hypothetical protein AB4Y32_23950 [Paraburkholderia phymatum]|uniref:Uncharacterized protein n=1 Tax=Paraburkholderia phymatum TaxID=148447 RepID=A0ACC6U521_9BURK